MEDNFVEAQSLIHHKIVTRDINQNEIVVAFIMT